MNKVLIKYCFAIVEMLYMCSCANYKDIPYFQNSAEFDGTKGAMLYDMTIKPKDQFSIFVTSTPSEAAEIFRVHRPAAIDITTVKDGGIPLNRYGSQNYYLVENDGTIEFPLVGKINLGGRL